MKKKRKSAVTVVPAMLIFLTISGLWRCSSEEVNYFQEETLTETISLGQFEAYDALEVDYLVETEMYLNKVSVITDKALGINFSNDAANRTLTMDFGKVKLDTLGSFFNRVRSGKIIVKYATTIGDSTANRTVTFENFLVNKKSLAGQIDVDNVTGDTIQLSSRCSFTDFTVTFPDGSGATYNGTQNRLWSSGENDFNPNNNSYRISNLSSSLKGTTTDGRQFECLIDPSTPFVLLNYYCALSGNYAGVSGIISVPALSGFDVRNREVNFGSVCDNQVVVQTWRRSFPLKVN